MRCCLLRAWLRVAVRARACTHAWLLTAAARLQCLCAGSEIQRWKRTYRVQDMAVAHNGALIIIACSDKQIHILRCCGRPLLSHCSATCMHVRAGANTRARARPQAG